MRRPREAGVLGGDRAAFGNEAGTVCGALPIPERLGPHRNDINRSVHKELDRRNQPAPVMWPVNSRTEP